MHTCYTNCRTGANSLSDRNWFSYFCSGTLIIPYRSRTGTENNRSGLLRGETSSPSNRRNPNRGASRHSIDPKHFFSNVGASLGENVALNECNECVAHVGNGSSKPFPSSSIALLNEKSGLEGKSHSTGPISVAWMSHWSIRQTYAQSDILEGIARTLSHTWYYI